MGWARATHCAAYADQSFQQHDQSQGGTDDPKPEPERTEQRVTEPYTQREALTPPTCPVCGTNTYVERDTMGGGITRHEPGADAATKSAPVRVWLCTGQCWTVFEGTQSEWERMRPKREARAKARAARGQGPHREPALDVAP